MRIGTRDSALALAQTHKVKELIVSCCGLNPSSIEVVKIKTTGDKLKNKDLSNVGGKGLFLKEIEEQLLLDNIDIAVHSTKDIPASIPEDLMIAAYLKRDYVEDVFISRNFSSIEGLPYGATFGTSSPRRRVQMQMIRPDLKFVLFRGNVNTRLQKLKDGEADATSLALCGIKRLGIDLEKEGYKSSVLPYDRFIPAVGQGVISVECRKKDKDLIEILKLINDHRTENMMLAERAFLETLKGTCKTPMAAYAEYLDAKIALHCMLANDEGTKVHNIIKTGEVSCPRKLGIKAAKTIQKMFL